MAARGRRKPGGHFERLARAGIIDRDAFRTKKDGSLTKASERIIEKIWDRVGGLIANPVARPFHTYKPRKNRAQALRQFAKQQGIPIAGIRGVIGIPMTTTFGVEVRGVRRREDGTFRPRVTPGSLVRGFYQVPLDPMRVIADPINYGEELTREHEIEPEGPNSVRILLGVGFWIPAEHDMTLGEAFEYLTEREPSGGSGLAPEILRAIEVLQIRRRGNGVRRHRRRD